MIRAMRWLAIPAILSCGFMMLARAQADIGPPPPPAPEPVPEVIEGTLECDPTSVEEFDACIGEETTAAEVCQMFADVVEGTRNLVSEIVHMKKKPKVGDKVKIKWVTIKVTIEIEGDVKAINDDGLATVYVTKITGEYKGVVAGLDLKKDWAVAMDWP